MKFTRRTLFKILIGKSLIEAVIVAGVAAAFYFSTTNANLRGSVDQADAQSVSGSAVDEKNAGRPLEVQLFIDDKFVTQALTVSRPDVHQSDRPKDDPHRFAFQTPPLSAGEHEARVYVLHRGASPTRRTLQLIGNPVRFRVEAGDARSMTSDPTDGRPR